MALYDERKLSCSFFFDLRRNGKNLTGFCGSPTDTHRSEWPGFDTPAWRVALQPSLVRAWDNPQASFTSASGLATRSFPVAAAAGGDFQSRSKGTSRPARSANRKVFLVRETRMLLSGIAVPGEVALGPRRQSSAPTLAALLAEAPTGGCSLPEHPARLAGPGHSS